MDSYPGSDIPIRVPILLDGNIGDEIRKQGFDEERLPLSLYAIENPEKVIAIGKRYLDSGAGILTTFTEGANSEVLKKYGMEDRVAELNEKAAEITYNNFHGKAYIAGCITSSGLYIEPYGESTFTELMDVYLEQVNALAPYCDMFLVQSVPTIWNMRAAVLACKKAHKPVIVTMCVDENGDTDIGTNALSSLIILQELGISAFGINCTAPDITAGLIADIAPYAKIPLIAKPVTSVTDDDGRATVLNPDELSVYMKKCLENSATIIGCCSDDTEYIGKMKTLCDAYDDMTDKVQKQDTSLVFADEDQVFFLEPDTTEFSPEIECCPDMTDIISDICDESYDVLTIRINSPDDAIDFAKNIHMATLPVAILSDNEISLKMALMLYQGRAIVDTKSMIEEEKLVKIASKYGAVLY